MKPITRRQAIRLGILGGLGVTIGWVGLSQTDLPWDMNAVGNNHLLEPEVLHSRDGVLRVELKARDREVTIAGQSARMLTYNDTVPGQTWKVQPGDRIEVDFNNQLDQPTNLRTHGLAVSPQDNGDNPFVSIEPGQRFEDRFDIPDHHPAGTF